MLSYPWRATLQDGAHLSRLTIAIIIIIIIIILIIIHFNSLH